MGIYTLGNTFQSELDDLLSDIKGVKLYINDILVLSKEIFSKHIYQLRFIFAGMRTAGLKFNAPKLSFVLTVITYLVYIITQDGIKSDPKKVQRIMDLNIITMMTEERELIGMYH